MKKNLEMGKRDLKVGSKLWLGLNLFLGLLVFSASLISSSVANAHEGDWDQPGISLHDLRFWYTGPGCFYEEAPDLIPSHLLNIAREGGVMVDTTEGYRMMVPFDPLLLTDGLRRRRTDDMITSTPYGVDVFRRFQRLPQDYVEVFQRPLEAGLCP